jgi:hypothetical protein
LPDFFDSWRAADLPPDVARVVFLRDEATVPSEQGLRCDQVRDLLQPAEFDLLRLPRLPRQPRPLLIRESGSPAAQLFLQHPDLLLKVVDGELLLAVHPSGKRYEDELECVHRAIPAVFRLRKRTEFRIWKRPGLAGHQQFPL